MGKTATKRCLLLFSWLFALLFSVSTAWCACGGERIGYETQQMQVGATQALTVTGARPEASYRWRVASGGGTLSATTEASVVYTAPSSNPDCVNNPVITLSSDGATCDTLQIAVHGAGTNDWYYPVSKVGAVEVCREHADHTALCRAWIGCDGNPSENCRPLGPNCGMTSFFCNSHGWFLTRPCNSESAPYNIPPGTYCSGSMGPTYKDIRTPMMKANGCCPAALLPAEPPPPACDVSVTSFGGTSTAIDVHNGGRVVFTGTIASSDPVSWRVTVAGKKIGEGTGLAVSVPWDGRLDGQVAEIGRTWPVKLVVETTDGRCSTEGETTVTVTASEKDCKMQVHVGSSAHLAAGSLSEPLLLFRLPGSRMMPEFSLSYDSGGEKGVLGIGWTHDYLETLTAISDEDRYVWRDGQGGRLVLYRNGEVHTPEHSSWPALAKNTDGTYDLCSRDLTHRLFDASGRLMAILDRNGNTVSLTYDAGNRLAAVTDPAGRKIVFGYDAAGLLGMVTDPNGNTHAFTYAGDTLTGIATSRPSGAHFWRFSYNDQGLLTAKTDPRGHETRYTYDGNRRLAGTTDPEGKTREIRYDPESSWSTLTEKDGGTWTFRYDPVLGVLLERTDPLGHTTRYGYDGNRNLVRQTEPDGSESAYTYDGYGNLSSVTDPLGKTTCFTYNGQGQVTSVTDPLGHTVTYGYDARGNLLAITDAQGAVTRYAHDDRGNVTGITDALGRTMVLAYDASGNLVSVTDPEKSTATLGYDSLGNRVRMKDALGNATTFDFDSLNRLIRITDPLGHATRLTRDPAGNPLTVTDPNGHATGYTYNYRDRVTGITDALGQHTILTYGGSSCPSCGGGADKLTAVTDAKGQTTTFEYDLAGRRTKETDPLGNATSHAYDARGNLAALTRPDGRTIAYRYDWNGRLLEKVFSDGSTAAFRYDDAGNLVYAGNQHIAYQFTYDANRRVTEVVDSEGRRIRYSYDALGNRTEMVTPEGKAVSYTYDLNGRLTGIGTANAEGDSPESGSGNASSGTYNFTYDSAGRRTLLARPGGTTTAYSYDAGSRLLKILHRDRDGRTLDTVGYTHDNTGNRVTREEKDRTVSYGYDAVDRLTEASPKPKSAKGILGKLLEEIAKKLKEGYEYDAVGNRVRGPGKNDSQAHDAGNRLLEDRDHRYEYDANGNLVRKTGTGPLGAVTTYRYDDENNLIGAEIALGPLTTEIEYAYDPFGRRIAKTVKREIELGDREFSIPAPRTIRYVYDNEDVILEYLKHGDREARTASYLHGPGIDEPLAVERRRPPLFGNGGFEVFDYLADGLGSVTGLTDSKGRLVQRYEYDSFGNPLAINPLIVQPYAFTGREYDPETGLYYYRARYYDPKAGRFITRDPIGFAGGDVNLFSYVWNGPATHVDPFGLAGDGQKAFDEYYNNPANWITGGLGPYIQVSKGHSDFYASDRFDWTKEDRGLTAPELPWIGTYWHFRSLHETVGDILDAIAKCNKDSFERAIHDMHDVTFHYDKGYRWWTLGHLKEFPTPYDPDNDLAAWNKSQKRTLYFVNMWNNKCGCK
ncbi:MAG TPA: RHS repeat-associated core domain-containing protein [Syntrophales bacterium]|mgnify:CR=1 FL=1|nr:RHS repeat-associated core domain-containing protein [Syntrophales bacterium]